MARTSGSMTLGGLVILAALGLFGLAAAALIQALGLLIGLGDWLGILWDLLARHAAEFRSLARAGGWLLIAAIAATSAIRTLAARLG